MFSFTQLTSLEERKALIWVVQNDWTWNLKQWTALTEGSHLENEHMLCTVYMVEILKVFQRLSSVTIISYNCAEQKENIKYMDNVMYYKTPLSLSITVTGIQSFTYQHAFCPLAVDFLQTLTPDLSPQSMVSADDGWVLLGL